MTPAPCRNGHPHTGQDALAELIATLKARGESQNDILTETFRHNRDLSAPLSDGEVIGLIASMTPVPETPTRKSQNRPPAESGKPAPDSQINTNKRENDSENVIVNKCDYNNLRQDLSENVNQDIQEKQIYKKYTSGVAADAADPADVCVFQSSEERKTEAESRQTESKQPEDKQPEEKKVPPARPSPEPVVIVCPWWEPLPKFLVWACEQQLNRDRTREAWESPLFHFTRLAKAHPDISKFAAADALEKIRDALLGQMRHHPAFEGDPFATAFGVSEDDAVPEFLDVWDKVRVIGGGSPLDAAYRMSQQETLGLSDEEHRRRGFAAKYVTFLSFAMHLQVIADSRPILLPVERVAKLLDVQPMTVSRYRQWAIQDGWLRIVHSHDTRGLATEFVFHLARIRGMKDRVSKEALDLWKKAKK